MRRIPSTSPLKEAQLSASSTQRQRGTPTTRSSSLAPSSQPRWLLLLAATLIGFVFLFGIRAALPPSTLIGISARAQAARGQQRRQADTDDTSPTGTPTFSASTSGFIKASKEQLQQQPATHIDAHGTGKHTFRGSSDATLVTQSTSGHDTAASGDIAASSTSSRMSAAGTGQQRQGLPPPPRSARVVVVGGGLAGLTAALQAAECLDEAASPGQPSATGTQCPAANCTDPTAANGGARSTAAVSGPQNDIDVLLVDKMPRLGGNSMKASSGINALAAAEEEQAAAGAWAAAGGTGAGSGLGAAVADSKGYGAVDSAELFTRDVTASGGGMSKPQLVEALVVGRRCG